MSHCACLQSWFCRRHLPSSQTHYSGCSDLRRILITSILPPFPCRPRRTAVFIFIILCISFHPWCSVRIACLHPPAGWMIYQARRIDRSSAESVDYMQSPVNVFRYCWHCLNNSFLSLHDYAFTPRRSGVGAVKAWDWDNGLQVVMENTKHAVSWTIKAQLSQTDRAMLRVIFH